MAQRLGLAADDLAPVRFRVDLPRWVRDGGSHRVAVTCAHSGEALDCLVPPEVCFVAPHLRVGEVVTPHVPGPNVRPPVSVIVLNRNGAALLDALLQSWVTHNTKHCEWIVVDHASSDDSLAVLARWQSRLPLRVHALARNQAFGTSCNEAARMARGRCLLFLNNDLIWREDALPELLRTLDTPGTCAVGMKLIKVLDGALQPVEEVQHLGIRFVQQGNGYAPFELDADTPDPVALRGPVVVPAVTGAALLCRRTEFLKVGGFSERYFYGFEDVELCLRMGAQLSKRLVCRNDLSAFHRHGYTRLTGRAPDITGRLAHNAQVLRQDVGLWVREQWWRELADGKPLLADETLRIGLRLRGGQRCGLPDGGDDPPARNARRLIGQLRRRWPHAELWLLQDEVRPFCVQGLHVLVVTDPTFDLRRLEDARADLRTVALLDVADAEWATLPWWGDFDYRVSPLGNPLARPPRSRPTPGEPMVARTTVAEPLGLRVLPASAARAAQAWRAEIVPDPAAHADADALLARLRRTLFAAEVAHRVRPPAPDDETRDDYVAAVVVWLLDGGCADDALPDMDPGQVNLVMWTAARADTSPSGEFRLWPGASPDAQLDPETVFDVAAVGQILQRRLGHTFSAS